MKYRLFDLEHYVDSEGCYAHWRVTQNVIQQVIDRDPPPHHYSLDLNTIYR